MKKITTLLFFVAIVLFAQRIQAQTTQNVQTGTFSTENQSIWGPGQATVYDERLNLFEDNGIDASSFTDVSEGEVLYLDATVINDAIGEVNNAIESYNDVFEPDLPTIPTKSSYPFGAEFDLKLGVNFDFYVDILISSGDVDVTYPTKFTFSYPDPMSFGCGDDLIIETSAVAESGYDLNLQEPILEIETGATIGTGAYVNGQLCAVDCTNLGEGYAFGNDFGNATAANYKSKLVGGDIGFIGFSTNIGLQLPWDLNPGLGIASDLFGGTPPLLTLPLETSDIPPFAGGLSFEDLTFITASVDNPFVDLNGNDFLNGNILTDNSSNTFLHAEWDPIQYLKYFQPQFQLTYGKDFLNETLKVELILASLPIVLEVTQDHTFELTPDFITDMNLGRVLSWEEYDGNTLVQSGTSQVVTGFVMGHSLKIVGYPDNVETPVVPTFNINAEFQTTIEEQFDIDLQLKFMQGNIIYPGLPFPEILGDLISDLNIPDLTFTVPNLFDPQQCDCTGIGVPSIDCIPDPNPDNWVIVGWEYPCGIGIPVPMCDCDGPNDPSPFCVPIFEVPVVDTYTCFPDYEFNLTQIFTDAISESSIDAGILQVGPFPNPTPSFDLANFELPILDKTFTIPMEQFNSILGTPFTLKPDDVPPVVVTQTIIRDIVGTMVIDPVLPQDLVASAIDEHGGTIEYISVTPNTFDCSNVGDNVVMVTVGDSRCNEITVPAIVTVRDVTDPVWVNAPTNLTVECDGAGNLAEFDNWLNNTFSGTDNCLNPVITNNYLALSDDCGNTGSQTVTFTLTDVGGNFITADATFIIEDTTPPIIGCPGDVTAFVNPGSCGAVVIFQPAAAIDVCGSTIVYQTAGLGSGSVFPVGDTLIEYMSQDECGNLSIACTFTITVVDDDAPDTVCQNITVQLDESGIASITANQINFGSTDNCGIDTMDIDISTFDCSNVGENEVALTVTDIHGNTATCIAIVTVVDVTAPEVVCNDITVELNADGTVTIDPMDVAAGSSDACGIATYELNIDTFSCLDVGNSTVILTVTDVNGNQSSCSATVTVEDNTAPELVCMDITLELNEDGIAYIIPSQLADANDPCDVLVLSADVDEVTCADIGTPVTVNIFANDGNGNASFCSSTVTVVDVLGPQIVCPENEQVNLDPNGTYTLGDYIDDGIATVSDNCTDPVTIFSQDPVAGTILGLGEHTITYTAEDEYGNVSTCSFELDVEEMLGVNDQENFASLVLYPNPADNKVHLSNPRQIDLSDVTIYDLTGRIVNKIDLSNMGSEITIDVSTLANAVYMLVIKGNQGVSTKQLIVNN